MDRRWIKSSWRMKMSVRLPEWLRKEIKKVVREAMDDWVKDVEYLHQPTDNNGRYYCSKSDCEGVRFNDKD